jgi:membrane fusion protein (multidrug efflux system)
MLSSQMNASPVIQIMKTDLVVAIVQLPELQLPRVSLGTPARVHVDGAAQSYDTSVAVLNARVDAATRAFEVRLPIANSDLALRPGLFARAELLPPPRELLALPRSALLGPEGERFVFALAEGRAARRAAGVRDLDARRVELQHGLAAGEAVLVGPNLGALRDGSAVSLELASAHR